MFNKENRAGLYLTISIHLLILVVFLIIKIHTVLNSESVFVIDFKNQEAQEKKELQERIKEEAKQEIEALFSNKDLPNRQVRNVVVEKSNTNANLKDDRLTDASQLYDEAKRVQERLDASKREMEAENKAGDIAVAHKTQGKDSTNNVKPYKGASVISYTLDGRKAMSLPVPAYKCLGGGDVSVMIKVNRKGYVVEARVIGSISSPNECIREYAVLAALSSRFSASNSAPETQKGEIVYRFIAQ